MSRITRRPTAISIGLAGIILAFGPAQASTPPAYGPVCAVPTSSSVRLICRPVRITRQPVRPHRRLAAEGYRRAAGPTDYGLGRYVSLLILGVGF